MQQVMQWLERNIPESDSDANVTRISHGDYKRVPTHLSLHTLIVVASAAEL